MKQNANSKPDKTMEILMAQSAVILDNAERLMQIQAALESISNDLLCQFSDGDDDFDFRRHQHYQLRKKIFAGDLKESNNLLRRLQMLTDGIGNRKNQKT